MYIFGHPALELSPMIISPTLCNENRNTKAFFILYNDL